MSAHAGEGTRGTKAAARRALRRRAAGLIVLTGLMLPAACRPPGGPGLPSSSGPTRSSTPSSVTVSPGLPPSVPAGAPCGWSSAAPPARWDHVVLVIFENKSMAQMFAPTSPAPYIKSLASTCGLATNFWSVWTRSLANYLALTSGSTHGQTVNPPPAEAPIAGDSIFEQLGTDWTTLAESATKNCQLNGGDLYNPRHIPAAYYTDVRSVCEQRVVPQMDPPDLSRSFTMIIPNMLNDMHMTELTPDIPSRIKAGDDWLRGYLPKLLATPEYRAGRTVILITWDEGQLVDSNIPLFVVSPFVNPGARETRRFDHYSLLRTMQEMLGLGPFLGSAANAASMRGGALEL